jgi:hypothetical protein
VESDWRVDAGGDAEFGGVESCRFWGGRVCVRIRGCAVGSADLVQMGRDRQRGIVTIFPS